MSVSAIYGSAGARRAKAGPPPEPIAGGAEPSQGSALARRAKAGPPPEPIAGGAEPSQGSALDRRPLVTAAAFASLLHASALIALALVVRRGADNEEPEVVVVSAVDDALVSAPSAAVEAPAAEPTAEPEEARFVAERAVNPTRERAMRVPATAANRSFPARTKLTATDLTPPPFSEGADVDPLSVLAVSVPAAGGAAAGSFDVPDLPAGDDAAARAKRSDLAAFMRKVQAGVHQHWHPSEVYARVDPEGRMQGAERQTVLRVRLRADGTVERADVDTPSGVPELDREAQQAFQRAQPFERPPSGALDAKGGLSFPFGLSLDLVLARFRSDVKRLLRAEWRPARVIRARDRERMAIVRVLLTFEGVVAHATVESASGSQFFDAGALEVFKPGMRLPRPPATLGEVAGLVPVRVAFVQQARGDGDVQVVIGESSER